jgi:hypothetical protein
MPMFSAMARTTVGPAPLNSPIAPSSFTILTCKSAAHRLHDCGCSWCFDSSSHPMLRPEQANCWQNGSLDTAHVELHRMCELEEARGS